MLLDNVYDFVYNWIDIVINGTLLTYARTIQSVGICTFTNNSNIVTGTDFITNNVVQNDGYIKIGNDLWAQIDTVDSEIQITLKKVYRSSSNTDTSYYSNVGINIIRGSQNAPMPNKKYIVVHEPPISNRKVGNVQRKQTFIDGSISKLSYSNTWQCTINIEEVNSTGEYLEKINNTIEEDSIRDIWNNQRDISFVDFQAGSANNQLIGDIIRKRYSQELFLLYTEETIIESEIIETVEISETNYS